MSADSVNLRKKRIKIGNLMMEVVQGDITEERTDVIVNSTNEDLNLAGGNLSRLLLNNMIFSGTLQYCKVVLLS